MSHQCIHQPYKEPVEVYEQLLFNPQLIAWLLFGVNEKLLTQHISGLLTRYKLLYVSNQGRVGARAWARVRARAKC